MHCCLARDISVSLCSKNVTDRDNSAILCDKLMSHESQQ